MRCVNLSNLCDCVCMHMHCCPVIVLGRRVCVNLPNTTVCVCVCVCVCVGVHDFTCDVLCINA